MPTSDQQKRNHEVAFATPVENGDAFLLPDDEVYDENEELLDFDVVLNDQIVVDDSDDMGYASGAEDHISKPKAAKISRQGIFSLSITRPRGL